MLLENIKVNLILSMRRCLERVAAIYDGVAVESHMLVRVDYELYNMVGNEK